jgi:uncharacterized protein YecE (DUF72 family)
MRKGRESPAHRVGANEIWIGCCGWPAARARYFEEFRTVELQSTFYEPPPVALAEKWKREAPGDFRFCLKAWQLITHSASSPTYRKLKTRLPEASLDATGGFQPTEEVWHAWEATLGVARALGVAVIVFQCPASFRPTESNLRNLEAFFRRIGTCQHFLAWEPRGTWPAELVRDLCARLDLIHCVDPFVCEPVTAGVRYFRLHGGPGYRHQYSDTELRGLHATLTAGGETYVMFNNVWMREDAARLLAVVEREAAR